MQHHLAGSCQWASVPVSLVLDYASIPRTRQKSIALLLTEKSKQVKRAVIIISHLKCIL